MKKVSVIVPTYNCEKFLTSALDSMISQTYKCWEVIVIDDGSFDGTKDLVFKYITSNKDKIENRNIRYFYQNNQGLSSARNKGIKESTGEYVAFLDADDQYFPEMLEKCMNFLKNNKSLDIVVTGWREIVIDDAGKILNKKEKMINGFPEDSLELRKKLQYNFFLSSYLVTKKDNLIAAGGFDKKLLFGEDVDLWLRLLGKGLKAGVIPEPLFIYTKRKNSLTTSCNLSWLKGQLKLIEKYDSEIRCDRGLRKHYSGVLWDLARRAYYLKGICFFVFQCAFYSQTMNFSFKAAFFSLFSVFIGKYKFKPVSRCNDLQE